MTEPGYDTGRPPITLRAQSMSHKAPSSEALLCMNFNLHSLNAIENTDDSAQSTQHIVTGDVCGVVRSWDLSRGVCVQQFREHRGPVLDVKANLHLVVSCGEDGRVLLWDARTGCCERSLHGHEDGVSGIGWNSKNMYSVSMDGSLRVWDVGSGSEVQRMQFGAEVNAMSVGRWIVVGVGDGSVHVLRGIKDGVEPENVMLGHEDAVVAVDQLSDVFVSASRDQRVKLWRQL